MNQRKSLLLVLLLSIVLISGVVLALGRTNHPEPLQNPVQSEPVQSPARQHEPVQNQAQTQQDPVLVGRVLHVEGQLLRYVPEEQQWVAVLPDTPWGKDETLYSAEKTRAEMVLPNNTRVRIGPSTEIRLVDLTSGRTEVDLIAGTARLLNKSSEVEIKVATAFGYAVITAGTILEVCADGTSAELIALQGNANFVHSQTGSHFEVMTGSNSLLVDEQQVGVGTGRIDTAWRQWNKTRDNLWAKRLEVKGDSVKYVHPSIRDESYVLDRYGSWSRVYYDGAYRYFWRPAHVAVGWAPFTVGSWMYWYGDWCWVPSEPFGYVTHHYGNWVLVSGCWYWAPPVAVTVGIGGPLLDIRFGWYPGRVAWVHSGAHIGWLPLAPGEI
ncbi:MAG: FecR domain-containing protein [Desulforhabdus sp.]|jgi:hypothetical protein|nr:FecR domain-containing protein [Desulforhabdus sp.]